MVGKTCVLKNCVIKMDFLFQRPLNTYVLLCPIDLRLDMFKAGLVLGRKCLAAGLGSRPEVSGSLLFGLVEVRI